MGDIDIDHPHTDPGDGRSECWGCGKWVWAVTHSCKGVPVTSAAKARVEAAVRARVGDSGSEPTREELGDLATDRGVKMVVGWITVGVLAIALVWRWRQ